MKPLLHAAPPRPGKLSVQIASEAQRARIYKHRHEIYACELGQHPVNAARELRDKLDDFNIYIVVCDREEIRGFISITPPGWNYSLDKYLPREAWPFPAPTTRTFEVRLLTVLKEHRQTSVALLLMHGAFRWIEAHGGQEIIGMGRNEVAKLYLKMGMRFAGREIRSGSARYRFMHAPVQALRAQAAVHQPVLARLERKVEWRLPFSFFKPAECFHGGDFFKAIGERFDHLERARTVINADVLDAWFPPAPGVIGGIVEHLDWLLRSSPPTHCHGLAEAIAERRGIPLDCLLPSAGSSSLIFLALRQWLAPSSRVLLLDPTYGEYAHVLGQVIGCQVTRFPLDRASRYDVDFAPLDETLRKNFDLVLLVNPNSPTGRCMNDERLRATLAAAPKTTRFWIDETYIDYVPDGRSLETFAVQSENVVVCKSLSKVLALSGARVAYLAASPHQLESLRAVTPPWSVSSIGQIAAIRALADPSYYRARYMETATLRAALAEGLTSLGWDVTPGCANFLLCHLPIAGPTAQQLIDCCRKKDLYLRNAASMGANMGNRAIRVAVKDHATNERMLQIIREGTRC